MASQVRTVPPKYRPDLQALRGVASCAVVAGHCYVFAIPEGLPWRGANLFLDGFLNPQPAVLVFFALSGFVLGCQLELSPVNNFWSFFAYVIRRAFRLLPLTLFSILFAVLIAASLAGIDPQSAQRVSVFTARWLDTLLLQDFAVNPVLWSLNVEVAASLIFPAVYFIMTRKSAAYRLLLGPALAPLIWVASPFFVQFLIFFYTGVIVSFLPRLQSVGRTKLASMICVLSLVGIDWAPSFLDRSGRFYADWQGWMWVEPFFTLSLLYCIVNNPSALGVLNRPWVQKIGDISFAIYLLHLPIVFSFIFLSRRYGLIPGPGDVGLRLLFFALFTGVIFAISIALSILVYRWIEVPFIGIGRRLARNLTGLKPVAGGRGDLLSPFSDKLSERLPRV